MTVQAGLGITRGAAFDLQAVCSGFVYGLAITDGLLRTGTYKRALVIGAETFSRILDWTDRTTCVLFGDGAGAVVLEAQQQPGEPRRSRRPDHASALRRPAQVASSMSTAGRPRRRPSGHLRMEGRAVFKHAVAMITDVIEDAFRATGYTAADIDWFVPHQANKRIIDDSAHKLGIAPEKVVTTVQPARQHVGGVDPAGAQRRGASDGRIKKGDLVLLEAMGGGFTWGSALVRW